MNPILLAVILLGLLGIVFALILSFASRVFHVKVDRRISEVREALPGANCGACGFPGCDGLAAAIINDGAPITACPVGGPPLHARLAQMLGADAGESIREVAVVRCQGKEAYSKDKFKYTGIRDCRANHALQGGSKVCSYGCLGCGSCVDVCAFDAIHIIDGVAIVDEDKCTACKKCISECPRELIVLKPYDQEVIVKCMNKDKGKFVRQACSVGCIACGICVKQCPDGFKLENNLSVFMPSDDLDPDQVQAAIDKCPTKCIHPGLVNKENSTQEKAG